MKRPYVGEFSGSINLFTMAWSILRMVMVEMAFRYEE
jgi:hypothetical protein